MRVSALQYSALALLVAACSNDSPPVERPTDPRTCPAAPGPAAGDACAEQGQACHYAGSVCGPNWVCNDGRWEETGGRFSCGDCASDVRCMPADACNQGDGACTCGSDGVFACARMNVSTTDLPACPVNLPRSTSCAADGQICNYFSGTCVFDCECASGTWSCTETCGA